MKSLTVLCDVPAGPDSPLRRVAGLLDDNETIGVATCAQGSNVADAEILFKLHEAQKLAEAVLAGNDRAKTTPGLGRILSASVAVLCRVSLAAGALAEIPDGESDGRGDLGDRETAAGDEHTGGEPV